MNIILIIPIFAYLLHMIIVAFVVATFGKEIVGENTLNLFLITLQSMYILYFLQLFRKKILTD